MAANNFRSLSSVPPIMPKAIAMWLIDNTGLTFEQIASFCRLHLGDIKMMADGEEEIVGIDPVKIGQLSRDTIERCSKDPSLPLKRLVDSEMGLPGRKKKRRKYTPVARRQDKPNAIAWLIKYCPEMDDNHIVKLIGTTRHTIDSVRNRSHWNISNIKPIHPVSLFLCTQEDFEQMVFKMRVAYERGSKLKKLALGESIGSPDDLMIGTDNSKDLLGSSSEKAYGGEHN